MSTPPQPRAVLEDEWPQLRAAVNEVFRPQGGDLTAECPLLFDPAHRENLRVIVDAPGDQGDGPAAGAVAAGPPILAHAGFVTREALVLRRRIRVACIGAVFAAVAHRGQGLASRVFADALTRARAGADLVMTSGDRGLYRRYGFDPVPPLARFRVAPPPGNGAVPPAPPSPSLSVREARATDLNSMATLYDGEDVHFIRPPDDWSRLWGAGRLVDAPARFWMVDRAGAAVAYLAVQQAGPRPDGSPRPRRILEYAGERDAIVEGAAAVADELLVPSYDAATLRACERKGWFRAARQFLVTAETLTAQVLVIPWYGLNYV